MLKLRFAALALMCVAAVPCLAAPVSSCTVVRRIPHSTTSYTEGFFYRDGRFYEGTGMEGRSAVEVLDAETGRLLQQHDLPPQLFGEGIVDWHDSLYEWTWQTETGFILDRGSLREVGRFHYKGEGWGMTRTATELITSDGSATLRFRNPDTFSVTRQITVRDGAEKIPQLNELEYVETAAGGEILANVWHDDRIARIRPKDGVVVGWIDCTGLVPASERVDEESVLNGIAWDAARGKLYITGKQWPWIFEIRPPFEIKPPFEMKPLLESKPTSEGRPAAGSKAASVHSAATNKTTGAAKRGADAGPSLRTAQ